MFGSRFLNQEAWFNLNRPKLQEDNVWLLFLGVVWDANVVGLTLFFLTLLKIRQTFWLHRLLFLDELATADKCGFEYLAMALKRKQSRLFAQILGRRFFSWSRFEFKQSEKSEIENLAEWMRMLSMNATKFKGICKMHINLAANQAASKSSRRRFQLNRFACFRVVSRTGSRFPIQLNRSLNTLWWRRRAINENDSGDSSFRADCWAPRSEIAFYHKTFRWRKATFRTVRSWLKILESIWCRSWFYTIPFFSISNLLIQKFPIEKQAWIINCSNPAKIAL